MTQQFRGGYSWLGISPEKKLQQSFALSPWEKSQLDHDCISIHDTLLSFNAKIEKYNSLCKKYEELAGTAKGAIVLRQMEIMRDEIEKASGRINKILDETVTLTHHRAQKII